MNNQIVFAGMTEIADHFGVATNVVSNWISRYPDFPEPRIDLRMGRAWDLNKVVEWYDKRWAP